MRQLAMGERDLAQIVPVIRDLVNGGTAALADVTLTASATQTVVPDPNCKLGSLPTLVPTTATAASSGWWLKAVADGSFTIGHASSAATDRHFAYELRKP